MRRPLALVVILALALAVALTCAVSAGASKRSGRPQIRLEEITIENPGYPEEPEVEVRATIEPHALPTTYEVWALLPELTCEDLQACPEYDVA